MAIIKAALADDRHIAEMQSLPDSSLSATLKNLLLGFLISDLKVPTKLDKYLTIR